ncbi:hypothetical protein KY284_029578 [Solanum tuberosum]|nr:hypothetical protein KY284_029578 [Solanum tuberosum]
MAKSFAVFFSPFDHERDGLHCAIHSYRSDDTVASFLTHPNSASSTYFLQTHPYTLLALPLSLCAAAATDVGDPVTALNSKLVSASLAASLFSFALFKYSKSEPSNEISALKNEASEKLGFSVKGWLPVSALPVIFPLITKKINSPF